MRRWIAIVHAACGLALLSPVPALAQLTRPEPPPAPTTKIEQKEPPCPCPPEDGPPPPWAGSIGAGLALTAGNTDTSNINISFDLTSDPTKLHVFKAEALFLRGSKDGEDTVDRTSARARHEYHFAERTFLFGQFDYLRDRFKEIDYLVSPTAGIGHILADDERFTFTVDVGLGMVWEKNPGLDVDTSGAVAAGEQLTYNLSDTATLTHAFTALWKMDDFGDGLYMFRFGATAGLTRRFQIKLELIDTLKTRPPNDTTEENDVAFVAALIYKF